MSAAKQYEIIEGKSFPLVKTTGGNVEKIKMLSLQFSAFPKSAKDFIKDEYGMSDEDVKNLPVINRKDFNVLLAKSLFVMPDDITIEYKDIDQGILNQAQLDFLTKAGGN